jgi:TRAP-type C4-dicarboxylate transport system substrate-binding protein
LICAAATLLVVAWLAGAVLAGEKIVIKAGHVLAPTEPTHIALTKWAERMKERTGGQVEMQIFASSQLGSNRDMMKAVLGAAVIPMRILATPGLLYQLRRPERSFFSRMGPAKRLVSGRWSRNGPR